MTSTLPGDLAVRLTAQLGGFTGEIIAPEDDAYEQGRQVWNAMVDKRPGIILRPRTVDDVVLAVTVARENGLSPAVRGGGHSVSGRAMSDGGMTIDLRRTTTQPQLPGGAS